MPWRTGVRRYSDVSLWRTGVRRYTDVSLWRTGVRRYTKLDMEMKEQEITLTDILTAREERVAIQNALLAEYRVPVISFTMNMAGPVKVTALSHRAFLWGMEQLRLGFIRNRMAVKKEYTRSLPTGDEGYFAIDAPAERVKALCVEIEEAKRIGRFFDMDVIGAELLYLFNIKLNLIIFICILSILYFYILIYASIPFTFFCFPPLNLPVLLAAISPTFLPCGISLLTVEGFPKCC